MESAVSVHRARPGCDPVNGIVCNGDYVGRCDPGCASTQCCSPQSGEFRCVDLDPDGYCPAADLSVRRDEIEGRTDVQWRFFAGDDCALQERCVNGPGWRRLLMFATVTPNRGTADLFMGPPAENAARFEYSTCHDHYHFDGYAAYELQRDGAVIARGHKQAFCLMDTTPYPDGPDTNLHYTCENQGIQRDWQDVYGSYLDCQWVDVTDVAPGNYQLRVAVNTTQTLNERDYSNNVITVPVAVTPDDSAADPTLPCPTPREGANRQCGFARGGSFACTPGVSLRAGCSAACAVGSCTGDTVLRVCDGDAPCGPRAALAINDDSACRSPTGREDVCSVGRFVCPPSGRFTVLYGGLASDEAVTCNVAVEPVAMGGDAGAPRDAASDSGAEAAVDAASGIDATSDARVAD